MQTTLRDESDRGAPRVLRMGTVGAEFGETTRRGGHDVGAEGQILAPRQNRGPDREGVKDDQQVIDVKLGSLQAALLDKVVFGLAAAIRGSWPYASTRPLMLVGLIVFHSIRYACNVSVSSS